MQKDFDFLKKGDNKAKKGNLPEDTGQENWTSPVSDLDDLNRIYGTRHKVRLADLFKTRNSSDSEKPVEKIAEKKLLSQKSIIVRDIPLKMESGVSSGKKPFLSSLSDMLQSAKDLLFSSPAQPTVTKQVLQESEGKQPSRKMPDDTPAQIEEPVAGSLKTLMPKNYDLSKGDGDKPKEKARKKLSFSFKHDDVIATNLIKGQTSQFVDYNKILLALFISIAMPSIAAIAGFVLLDKWGEARVEKASMNLKAETDSAYLTISKKIGDLQSEEKYLKIKAGSEKFHLVKYLIDTHIYWNNIFKFFEDTTLPSVTYSGFGGDTEGSYGLAATARDTRAFLRQIEILRSNPYVLKADTNAIRIGGGPSSTDKENPTSAMNTVVFDLKLSLNPEIFYNYSILGPTPTSSLETQEPEQPSQVPE